MFKGLLCVRLKTVNLSPRSQGIVGDVNLLFYIPPRLLLQIQSPTRKQRRLLHKMADPCRLATEYAVFLSRARSVEELKEIGIRIRADLSSLVGWTDWLRDWYESCEKTLTNSWGKK
jgi:hypothetical protein